MTKKSTKSDALIAEVALRLIARNGWKKLTLEQIAKALKIPLTQIKSRLENISLVVPLIVDNITRQTLIGFGSIEADSSPRDRLFDILMVRFDVLQNHRKAILSIASSMRMEKNLALILIPAHIKAMQEMLKAAQISSPHICDKLAPIALWGVFLLTFRVWQTDETLDMSKTMAALDRNLRYAERTATFLRAGFQ